MSKVVWNNFIQATKSGKYENKQVYNKVKHSIHGSWNGALSLWNYDTENHTDVKGHWNHTERYWEMFSVTHFFYSHQDFWHNFRIDLAPYQP